MGALSKKCFLTIIQVFQVSILTYIFCAVFFSATIFASFNLANQSTVVRVNPGSKFYSGAPITNWCGTLAQRGQVTGSAITFDSNNGGVLNIGNTPAYLLGATYMGTAAQEITLGGNQVLRVSPGDFIKKVLVTGVGNKLQGSPNFTDDAISLPNITLQDGATALALDLQGKLTSFIALNGGVVTLNDNIDFGDTKRFLGTGTVNLNHKRVSFGGADINLTETVLWNDATDIVLNAKTILSGIWTFDGLGAEKEAHIIGNGNILDLGTTGTIRVRAGTKLYLTDIKLKGLGDGGYGSIVFDDKTSQIRLSQSEIELSNNYSVTNGGFYVEGSSRIITRDKNLIFALNGTLTVDGITLEYDTARFSDKRNIIPANSGASTANITLLNDGVITGVNSLAKENSNAIIKNTFDIKNNSNAIVSGGLSSALSIQNSNAIVNLTAFDEILTNPAGIAEDLTIKKSRFVQPGEAFKFVKSVTLDGGNSVQVFSDTINPQFILEPGVTVQIKNVILSKIHAATFQFGKNSNVIIGENVMFELDDNIAFNDGHFQLGITILYR